MDSRGVLREKLNGEGDYFQIQYRGPWGLCPHTTPPKLLKI